MNRFAHAFVAFGLAAAATTALAAQPEPVMMTDAQMDNVTAGAGLGDLGLLLQNTLNNLNVGSGGFVANVIADVNSALANLNNVIVGPTPTPANQ
jgi:hypothetical protein